MKNQGIVSIIYLEDLKVDVEKLNNRNEKGTPANPYDILWKVVNRDFSSEEEKVLKEVRVDVNDITFLFHTEVDSFGVTIIYENCYKIENDKKIPVFLASKDRNMDYPFINFYGMDKFWQDIEKYVGESSRPRLFEAYVFAAFHHIDQIEERPKRLVLESRCRQEFTVDGKPKLFLIEYFKEDNKEEINSDEIRYVGCKDAE